MAKDVRLYKYESRKDAGVDLIHEHVFQKAIMAEQLLRDVSMDVKKTLENAFGCVVTKRNTIAWPITATKMAGNGIGWLESPWSTWEKR
ncbi:MAG TPA: hypothetical protein VGG18_17390 [Granulicella sp.]|jgi:hypothetical protein